MHIKLNSRFLYCLLAFSFFTILLGGCDNVDLFEKRVTLPAQEWKSSNKPTFTFHITDTSSTYQLYLVLRHTEKYSFNNIYVDVSAKGPASDSSLHAKEDIRLGTDESGWMAEAMDDIYDHRAKLGGVFRFSKPGDYTFTLQQIMREDPLKHMIDVGIRLEKRSESDL